MKGGVKVVCMTSALGMVAACATGSPETTAFTPPEAEAAAQAPEPPQPDRDSPAYMDLARRPTFTPYTVQPDLLNRPAVARALEQAYPPALRDKGIGGTTRVWFFVDDRGIVRRIQINESSGNELLDQAALSVARTMEFSPAMNRGEDVPVWISMPITFTIRR